MINIEILVLQRVVGSHKLVVVLNVRQDESRIIILIVHIIQWKFKVQHPHEEASILLFILNSLHRSQV